MWKIEGQICPHCGSHLIIREGQYGQFLACPRFPACKFTKPLPDGDLKIYSPPSPYCKKCNHTGLLPFQKEGRVISHVFVDCSCKQQPERYQPLHLDDFDYPMSDTFRTASYQYCSQPDPGAVTASAEREVEVRYRPRPVDKEMDQLKGGFIHIQKVINEHVDASKKKRGKY